VVSGGGALSLQAETARARRAALRREYFMLCFPYKAGGKHVATFAPTKLRRSKCRAQQS
jgi:hypothetical protein